jgi:hypothetical protein
MSRVMQTMLSNIQYAGNYMFKYYFREYSFICWTEPYVSMHPEAPVTGHLYTQGFS